MSVNVVNKSTGALTKVAGNAITEASGINYSHTTSGMSATNVQDAIDESYGSLMSGLTNVQADVELNTNDLTTPSRTKNLLPITIDKLKKSNTTGTWSGNVYTIGYNTYTVSVNNNGVVTSIEGISTNIDSSAIKLDFDLKAGNYILSSGFVELFGANDTFLQKDGVTIARGNDASPGQNFTLSEDSELVWHFRVTKITKTCYPMIRPATITDSTFAPYIPSVESRIEDLESGLDTVKSGLTNQTARSRSNITSRLTNLVTAVAEQNLEKYGYKIGDYFTGASGYTYHLADMDTFYGGYNNNAIVNTHHISLVVKTGANSKWAETNDTSGGYKTSTLHSFLSSTVLDNIKSDMIALFGGSTGLEHLVSHKLLWTTATSAWAWSDNAEYISALSEPQVYGTNVWAIDGYQTGEAWKWLEIFHKFNYCEILGRWWWLRSISSASGACGAGYDGVAYYGGASDSLGAVGLIIFH